MIRVLLGSLALIATGLILLTSSAHAADARQLIRAIEQIEAQTYALKRETEDYGKFHWCISDAYQTTNMQALGEDLSVALITENRISDATDFYTFGGDQPLLPAASTVKITLLARLMNELESENTGGKWALDSVDYGPLARAMIGKSDNNAANQILARYKVDGINNWLGQLSITPSDIHFQRPFKGEYSESKLENLATAAGLAKFMFLCSQEESVTGFLNSTSLAKFRSLLSDQGNANNLPQFNDRLNANFPGDVTFIHKTGSNFYALADVGLVIDGDRKFIIAVIDGTKNKPAMQRLGRNLLEFMRSTPLSANRALLQWRNAD